jgi:hypothetical protein
MSLSNLTELEKGTKIGSLVEQFVYRIPKKNYGKMQQITAQADEISGRRGVLCSEAFQLTSTNVQMEGFVNTSNIVSADPDEGVWIEKPSYRDRKHMDEVKAKCGNYENMGRLCNKSLDLLTRGIGFIIGGVRPSQYLDFTS